MGLFRPPRGLATVGVGDSSHEDEAQTEALIIIFPSPPPPPKKRQKNPEGTLNPNRQHVNTVNQRAASVVSEPWGPGVRRTGVWAFQKGEV